MAKSALQIERAKYRPKLPDVIKGDVEVLKDVPTESIAEREEIKKLFPKTSGKSVVIFRRRDGKTEHPAVNAGVILSGGQAPGGHNVIAGLFDGIKRLNPGSRLYGFRMGPKGLVEHEYVELTAEIIDEYRNTGGFDVIGSGRTKLEKVDQFEKGREILDLLGIKSLVIIGGDDSNTNACILAEYYAEKNYDIRVIGCPKTIDGDLKNGMIETSFGFDTACKVYSEVIGNIQRDCNSARKYWHFIKLMGRSASHIALECALQVQPNICLISEEIEAKGLTLDEVVTSVASVVARRAEDGNNFGTVLIPEGLIEFIPAFRDLIRELNDFLSADDAEFKMIKKSEQVSYVTAKLSASNSKLYASLPDTVARQLTLDRDPHGNVQVSLIETEKLLAEMVAAKLSEWKSEGRYGGEFAAQTHFFGYEGRCAAPSNYDADYCYSLGYTASCLIGAGLTGYMSSVRNTTATADKWIAGGVPFTMMMNIEHRNGVDKPVIRKALVDLNGKPFGAFAANRDSWALNTEYVYPGPIQYFGPPSVCDRPTKTLLLEKS
ncbi:MAG: diphosphate--fructose-6-phosphate 1-phosphotransferase [Dysgonamonadaceae bacterium]|jgi:pyrophosphate--fructose-6-phosphate 1-phosphotransferase|nr:diphosphate--fructose-6-phosphate 1-phosphotransferase [Dysgonamonadaceae bacterium]